MSNQLELRYDYSEIEEEERSELLYLLLLIKESMKQSVENIFRVGMHLHKAREFFSGEDEFISWCDAELSISRTQAYRFMAVFKRFGDLAHIAAETRPLPSVLYELASESLDEERARSLLTGAEKVKTTEGEKEIAQVSNAEIRTYKEMIAERDRRISDLEEILKRERFELDKIEGEKKKLSSQGGHLEEKLEKLNEEMQQREERIEELTKNAEALQRQYESNEILNSADERKLFEITVQMKNALSKLRKLARRDPCLLSQEINDLCTELIKELQALNTREENCIDISSGRELGDRG